MHETEGGRLPQVYAPLAGEEWQNYVFISYNHQDADFVYEDLRVLHENGARFWYDEDIHEGDDWIHRATERINDPNCSAVLFYFTVNSLGSKAVFQEFKLAKARKEREKTFSFITVNAPDESVFRLLKKTNAPEEQFHEFLDAFPERHVHISRTTDTFYRKHHPKLATRLDEVGAIDKTRCSLLQLRNFEYREINGEMEITKYVGADTVFSVPQVIGEKKVVSIGINAFKNNKSIKHIRIPEGVERIDDFAFSGCSALEGIILPNSLQTLGYETFRDCGELKSIDIPRNVRWIGDYCFYRCHKLKNLQLQSEVPLTLAFAAFSECQSMESLTLPESTESIGPYAFNCCINLKSIAIPRNVNNIGLSAFYSCTSLKEVYIHAETVLENKKLFFRCRNLEQITFRADQMDDYEKLADWDDHREIILYVLAVPQNVLCIKDRISWEASPYATGYTVRLNGVEYPVEACCFSIPKEAICDSYEIAVCAQCGEDHITSSAFSEEVRIERNEWNVNEKGNVLEKYNGTEKVVTIPQGITEIKAKAFFNHDGLEKVIFPDGLRMIGQKAFYHCTQLKEFEFPESLKVIESEAFFGTSISTLTIPKGVERIGDSCFAGCNNLETLTINAPNMKVGSKAFYRCINLNAVSFPNGFYELYPGMFRGCTELNRIPLPEGLHSIRDGAISYIMRLESICVPASVTTIEAGAFSNSFGLTSISVAEGNETYFSRDGVLLRKNRAHTIIHFPADMQCADYRIAEDVSEIGAYAFMDAEHLRKVTVVGKMEEIGISAFERCPNLEEVVIEKELEYIRKNAFKDCFNLRSLYLLGSVVPELDNSSFENVSEDLKIYIPEKYIAKYRRDSEWKKIEARLIAMQESE